MAGTGITPEVFDAREKLLIDQTIVSHRGRPGALLGILEDVQSANAHKFLSMEALRYIADQTGIPPARVFSVASFYSLFNLDPQGDNVICVCRGTACHTRGSRDLLEKLCLDLGLSEHEADENSEADKLALTTPDRRFTVRTVACFGQCALAPVVEINHHILSHVNERTLQRETRALVHAAKPREAMRARGSLFRNGPARRRFPAAGAGGCGGGEEMMARIQDIGAFNAVREAGMAKLLPAVPRITVGMGTCGRGNGAEEVYHALNEAVDRSGMEAVLTGVGCFGACFQEPLVGVRLPGKPLVILRRVHANDAARILEGVATGAFPQDLWYCKIEEWDHITSVARYGQGYPEIASWNAIPFFSGQKKIVLRNCGLINPSDIEEYVAVGGYQALYKVLIDGRAEGVIEQMKAARLRGRGGAGFLTGNKWDFMAKAKADAKYIVCNADEGDPGAYMNRNEIEGDPHALLEGMIVGAYAMAATEGIIYVRAEYPLAVRRLTRAIEQAREYGLLGANILDRGFKFDIELVQGAGAFVCGEETALLASLEGYAGRPRPRPPYPAQKGLWGRPTNINNVETWYNIAPIVTRGPGWFAETGSVKSPGTKVFSLVGKVQNTGLVEMPLGTPLKSFIYDIGEGAVGGRRVKAVQTGGPSGGCIPVEMLDTPVDYESLAQLGSIMGSGGMVVMDEDNCMVDVARYFVEFTHSESCGKCVPCRVGLNKALRILNAITRGQGDGGATGAAR